MLLLGSSSRFGGLASLVLLAAACSGGGGGDTTSVAPAPDGGAVLAWDAADPSLIAGYRVYFGTATRAYDQALGYGVNTGNTTTLTLTGLNRGQTYYFAITSVDALGGESAYSDEASKVIP